MKQTNYEGVPTVRFSSKISQNVNFLLMLIVLQFKVILILYLSVAKRKACLQPEKTRGFQISSNFRLKILIFRL